jgi:hypothetical protein
MTRYVHAHEKDQRCYLVCTKDMIQMSYPIKVGATTSTGQIISEVLGQSKTVAVYQTDDGHLRWSYFGNDEIVPDEKKPFLATFDGLMQTIKAYLSDAHKDDCLKLLGKSLFRALDTEVSQSGSNHFEEIASTIENIAQQNARFSYVSFCFAALGVCVALSALSVWVFSLEELWGMGVWCGVMGAAGAAISIAHRIRDLSIEWKSQPKLLAAEGCARILVGFFFGVLFYLMCKSDLVLGALNDNFLALLVFSTIAGFSERFIPELMEKLEARASESTSTAP